MVEPLMLGHHWNHNDDDHYQNHNDDDDDDDNHYQNQNVDDDDDHECRDEAYQDENGIGANETNCSREI